MSNAAARRVDHCRAAAGLFAAGALGAGPRPAPTDSVCPASAQHAGRSFLESGGETVMPIFDQGYQHWSGTLSGHAWRWLAITRQGVRAGMKNRILRIVLLVAWLPALLLVA